MRAQRRKMTWRPVSGLLIFSECSLSAIFVLRGIHKCVYIVYTCCMITKNVGFRLRVEKELRSQFVEACREQGKPAAYVLREFMRDYVKQYIANRQGNLFITEQPNSAKIHRSGARE